MVGQIEFRTDTDLARGLRALLDQLELRVQLTEPVQMFIAGGMATHLYTQERVTAALTDIPKRTSLTPSPSLMMCSGAISSNVSAFGISSRCFREF